MVLNDSAMLPDDLLRRGAGLVVGLAADDLEASADLDGATEIRGHLLRLRSAIGHELDRLAPHQVHVGVARRCLHRRV